MSLGCIGQAVLQRAFHRDDGLGSSMSLATSRGSVTIFRLFEKKYVEFIIERSGH
jgi:hypothetical protein